MFPPFIVACYQWLEDCASSVDALLRTPDRDEMAVIAELRKRADANGAPLVSVHARVHACVRMCLCVCLGLCMWMLLSLSVCVCRTYCIPEIRACKNTAVVCGVLRIWVRGAYAHTHYAYICRHTCPHD